MYEMFHTESAQSMAPADASAEKDMAKLFERSNRDLITILRLMQLMGEGFNTQLKEYLRFQKDNYRSVNLLGQTISLFRDLISRISKSQLTFLEFQTIVTLVELTQGCPTNQDDAFTSHIAEHINHLLRTGVNDLGFTLPQEAKGAYPNRRWRAILPWRRSASITATPDPEQPPSAPNQPSQQSQKMLCPKRARVIFELGKLLLALLENDDEETKRRAGVMIDMLNFEAIAETMIEFYEWQEEPACVLKCDEDWPESQVGDLELEQIGFTFYQVWARFKDLTGQDCWDGVMDADDKRFLEAKKFYVTEGSCLEVEFSGVTHKIHFFDSKAPQVFNNEKKRIIYTVSTDNTPHKEKLQKFKEKCKSIAKDVEQRERVANVFKPLLHWSSWSYSLICLTLIIQAILLAWVTTTATAEGRRPIHRPGWLPDWVLLALSIAHTVLSVLTTVSHVLLHRPTLPQFLKRWRTKKDKAQPTAMSVHDQLPQCPCWSCFNKQRTEGKRTTSAAPGQTWSKAMRRARRGRRKMKDEVEFNVTTGRASYKRTRWPLLSATLLHHFLLVGMSLAGTLSNPFFFTYHLFHIIPVNEILRRVLKALVKRFIDLMLVAALIVAMIFTYSILVFVYFRDSVSREDGFWCDTFGQCFLSSVRFTMIEGFGGVLVPESSVWHTNAGRAIFDMCFFILVTCLGGGLILGIIIDTFQDLRNDKWSIDDAMKSKCFICGRTSFQLSQQQGETARASDWQEHVSEQHNMWDYLYFYIYLLHKDENEYTHHEHKVFYMKSNELEFPTQQGKSLVSEAACCL
ncbi:hypothetical protein PTSG_04686 [Salpingoeca rosetta]|uniref:Ion transport domain-containing protein n=1 Tax=Salpingoeca rosetta (strain ATCC 50818 / BSB-021) TaxID=946362 RepID=F2U850_SALR5|nr:uncharacterized protein PTSG_04686 [Salpingoeca rosetta]EGD72955.1 hypothetical protein PTSG_04686 [Salpingoeca rosetta]|eukprot:XP_004994777.1 hypothetical protein PTSG_04686 [Salpingoeca rosetta]